MGILTALLYGALAVYLGGWIMDWWIGNFSLLLLLLTAVTSLYWLAERFRFKPARQRAAQVATEQAASRRGELTRQGIEKVDESFDEQARAKILAQPWWLDWTAGLFPVFAAVFFLRSFVVEPFKIPSGSMLPTLEIGDLILVNKYHYGLRLPVAHTKLVDNNAPKRGDVVVFRYPPDPRVDYIKRIVGVPGDEVTWRAQKLTINGSVVPTRAADQSYDPDARRFIPQSVETFDRNEHRILVDTSRPSFAHPMSEFVGPREACSYSPEGVSCKVPAGHLFVMGDNRDNSQDSRFWGFVPEGNLVGRAFVVWMNFGNFGRIGAFR
jgi:signal peptidase I